MNVDEIVKKIGANFPKPSANHKIKDDKIKKVADYLFAPRSLGEFSKLHKLPFYLFEQNDKNQTIVWNSDIGNSSISTNEPPKPRKEPKYVAVRERGHVLETFLRIEFILNHLFTAKVGAYSENGDPKFTYRIFVKTNSQQKYKYLKKYFDIPSEIETIYHKLIECRNQYAHLYEAGEAKYDGDGGTLGLRHYYKDVHSFQKFINDEYLKFQPYVLNYLVEIIDSNQE